MSHHDVANLWGESLDLSELTFIVRERLGRIWPIILNKLNESITAWIPARDPLQGASHPFLVRLDRTFLPKNLVYILDCDQLHPIDHEGLLELVEDTPLKKGKKELLEGYEELIDIDIDCSFHDSPPPRVAKARRITPLAAIGCLLHEIPKRSIPPDERPQPISETAESSGQYDDPSISRALSEFLSPSQRSSSSTPPQTSSRSPSTQADGKRSPSFLNRFSWKTTSKREELDIPRPKVYLSAALSLDATNLVIWSQVMISCWSITDRKWGNGIFLKGIVLAAAARETLAVVSQRTNGDLLSLYDVKTSNSFGASMMSLPERPWSMAFSNDGLKLGVGTQTKLRIISTHHADWAMPPHWEERELPHEAESFNQGMGKSKGKGKAKAKPIKNLELEVCGQTMCFSPDGTRLVVATNFQGGDTSVLIFNLSNDLRVLPYYTVIKREFLRDSGISASPCFHDSEGTYFMICADTARSQQPEVVTLTERAWSDENPSKNLPAKSITGNDSGMKQIQAALPLPGSTPAFVMISGSDQVLIVRRSGSGRNQIWGCEVVQKKLERQRTDEDDRRQRVKIAATSAEKIAIFYIWRGQGWLAIYDVALKELKDPHLIKLNRFS